MSIRKHISRLLFGLQIPKQYVATGYYAFSHQLKTVFCSDAGRVFESDHVLLGYKPVLIAIPASDLKEDQLIMNFRTENGADVANLRLIKRVDFEGGSIYEATTGQHRFISLFHQYTNTFRERFRVDHPDNVKLPGNLYDQVRIAYCLPRIIALISVSEGTSMNLFPTDLHGQISDVFYLSSLRISGKAQEQVQRIKRIVLSEVALNEAKWVYAFGKNHMRDMRQIAEFDLASSASASFSMPLPRSVVRYYELEVYQTFDVGIHRIFLYKIVGIFSCSNSDVLSHIHQYYAQWRLNHNIPTEYLPR